MTSSLLSTRHSSANEEQSFGLELGSAPDRVGEVRVATVDDDISLLEVRLEERDKVVDGRSGLDEENDLAGSLELAAKLLDRVGADDGLA